MNIDESVILMSAKEIVSRASEIELPRPSIYFLIKDQAIVYIGQSVNGIKRVQEHRFDHRKQFDRVYFLDCPIEMLDVLESWFVHRFQPVQNGWWGGDPNSYGSRIPPARKCAPLSVRQVSSQITLYLKERNALRVIWECLKPAIRQEELAKKSKARNRQKQLLIDIKVVGG